MEQLSRNGVAMAHLIPRDVIESFLRVGIGVVSVLIRITARFAPVSAVSMKKLQVTRLIGISTSPSAWPNAIFNSVA